MKAAAMKVVAMKAVAMKTAAMKPAMKAAMKKVAMKKVVMKKAMKVSKVATGVRARLVVFQGRKEKTTGGLSKDSLRKNKKGTLISKAASAASKKKFATSVLRKWADAAKQVRKE